LPAGTEPPLGHDDIGAARRRLILDGLGIIVSAAGFGFVYGLTARTAGHFSPIEAMAMSLIAFGGAAQFAAIGYVSSGLAWPAIGLLTFLLNARHVLYSAALAPWFRRRSTAERAAAHAAAQDGTSRVIDWTRYATLLRSSHVWLLAPTWIAVNASIGLWFSQSIFQFSRVDPRFPEQVLHRGFHPMQISLAAVIVGIVFGAGLLYWGNRFRSFRRTTIILYGILGGAVLVAGGLVVNHAAGLFIAIPIAGLVAIAFGLFVLAGATPAALGLLADMSERFPSDRGAIMGLYSVFLAVGQIIGSLIGGVAADMHGIDGLLIATIALLLVALLPLALLRRQEHQLAMEHPELEIEPLLTEGGS
jgi:predicted MFS family arabinose efflux permease